MQYADRAKATAFASWAEQQALELVAFASGSDSPIPSNWNELFLQAVMGLCESVDTRYTRQEKMFIQNLVDQKLVCSTGSPGMTTILRLASMQATSVIQFIQSPIESSSPRLFNIGGARDAGTGRKSHPPELWQRLLRLLEDLLQTADHVLLPSKANLLKETGFQVSGIWQHDPELSVRYERERIRRAREHTGAKYTRTLASAFDLLREAQIQGRDVCIRNDGRTLSKLRGVSKHVAERALNAAIVSRSIIQRHTGPGLAGRS
jgi:hypothetical protein